MSQKIFMADPASIEPYKDGVLQVVIETPRNSRNKYAFDHELHIIVLKKLLPAGMSFPFDFGFVPSTLADDGDQIDVLVLMDEPAFSGCVVETRLIGVIEGEDELEGGRLQRNDRVLAVALVSQTFSNLQTIDDLPQQLLKAIEQFFVNYPLILSDKVYRLVGTKGPAEARELVEAAGKTFRAASLHE